MQERAPGHHPPVSVRGVGVGVVDADGVLVEHDTSFARQFGVDGSVRGELLPLVSARFGDDGVGKVSGALAADAEATVAVSESIRMRIGPVTTGRREVTIEGPITISGVAGAFDDSDPARVDPLTGLGNRRRLDEVLEAWDRLGSRVPLALMMVDLDRFKQVNDSLGHSFGDQLLSLAAARIASATRQDEEVIRMGGDEFVVLHGGSEPLATEAIAERIVEFLRRPFLLEGQQVNIGASIGIAVLHEDTGETVDLLRHADLALYEAKAAGRGTHRRFQPELARRATERRDLETRVRRALVLRELALHYQPQVRASDGRVVGFEALLRWHNEVEGDVPPATLIPVAEEIGEIHAIGEWVLRQACEDAMTWAEPVRVAVNVSPSQLERPGFEWVVGRALEQSGLPGDRLEIEITETILFTATPPVLAALDALSELGVHIAIDDFGTGFSSLAQLNSFPFSSIKIDQSFIRGERTDRTARLVSGIIALGQRLGLSTIAEGVETPLQAEELVAEGCEELQGFLIARPMPPDSVHAFLSEHAHRDLEGETT